MKNAFKWALYITVVNIIVALGMYLAGISLDPDLGWIRWIGTIASLVLIFLGVREKKMEDPSSFTFGKGWVATVLICCISAVLGAVWVFIYASAVEPEWIEVTRNAQKLAMMKQSGGMTKEQMEQAMKWSSFMISPAGFAIFTLVSYVFIGMILGLIVSAIVKATGNDNLPPTEPMA